MAFPIISISAKRYCWDGEVRHPFDAGKWGRIQTFLTENGILDRKRIVEPVEATKDDLLVV